MYLLIILRLMYLARYTSDRFGQMIIIGVMGMLLFHVFENVGMTTGLMVLGLVVLYAFGTAWFVVVYSQTVKAIDFQTAISLCVLPFLIPEAIKAALAIFMVRVIPTRVKAFR